MKPHTLIRHEFALYPSISRRSIRAASLLRAMPIFLVALLLLVPPAALAALAGQTLDPRASWSSRPRSASAHPCLALGNPRAQASCLDLIRQAERAPDA